MIYQEYLTCDSSNKVRCENCKYCVKQYDKNIRNKRVCKNKLVIEADSRVKAFEVDIFFGYCQYFDERNKNNSCHEINVDSVLEIE